MAIYGIGSGLNPTKPASSTTAQFKQSRSYSQTLPWCAVTTVVQEGLVDVTGVSLDQSDVFCSQGHRWQAKSPSKLPINAMLTISLSDQRHKACTQVNSFEFHNHIWMVRVDDVTVWVFLEHDRIFS